MTLRSDPSMLFYAVDLYNWGTIASTSSSYLLLLLVRDGGKVYPRVLGRGEIYHLPLTYNFGGLR
jgi:hypothetical protein